MNDSDLPPGLSDEVPPLTEEQKRDEAEYADFHVFYHDHMNFLADRVFNHNDHIDYVALLLVFCAMHRSAPLGSTPHDVLDDHLDDLVTPLLSTFFGHD